MVHTEAPCFWASCLNVAPSSRSARIFKISSASSFFSAGRPSCTPRRFALLIPNRILSTRIDRSSEATAPNTVKTIMPVGVEVSIASVNEQLARVDAHDMMRNIRLRLILSLNGGSDDLVYAVVNL
jgi:hypothetical protein